MSPNKTPIDLGEVALTALGNDVRRQIIGIVAQHPSSTNQIAERFSISRPAISKHLKILTDAGLVERRTQGTQSIYQLEEQGFVAGRAWLSQFWPDALLTLKSVAERTYLADTNE